MKSSVKDMTRQKLELAHWQEWESRADAVWGWQTPAGQRRAHRRANLFRYHARLDAASVVLEIGCGTGEFTQRIAGQVAELWATDLSPELLARARDRVQRAQPGVRVEFAIQDAMDLTLPTARFDAVYGCSVLHHLEARGALREIHRVLKPGGWCVFSEPNMLNPQIAVQKNVQFVKRRLGDTPNETAFFRWPLQRMLADAGFRQISIQPFDFLHPLTPTSWLGVIGRIGEFLERIPVIREISGSLLLVGQKPAA
jgi:SAM-dependent methyltransferase